ncbi:VOC family protein [Kineococcus endophyticus]|uniref:VOC family protein n=1 Tax=Kineococcus endophyticus TaxID=1181883 RepID=A0ABV3P4J3_9ACTN
MRLGGARSMLTSMTSSTASAADQPVSRPTGLHHVRLSVSDIERSRTFYSHLLGADPAIDNTSELTDPTAVDDPQRLYGGVVFEVGDQILGLRPVPGAAGETFTPSRVGLDHVSLAVSSRADLEAAAARMSAAGVEHGEIIELSEQNMQILSIQDPDDINLELTAPL